jgi:hypothetical protein
MTPKNKCDGRTWPEWVWKGLYRINHLKKDVAFCCFHHFTTTIPVVGVVDVVDARLTKVRSNSPAIYQ